MSASAGHKVRYDPGNIKPVHIRGADGRHSARWLVAHELLEVRDLSLNLRFSFFANPKNIA
ncbi:hypothetical protein RU07_16245 [Agrobacterium tumefaciens]|uniref:Transposase n=1 Tax=Agrobacterium tumefaciens TaxID=358 RepID=A0A0D0JZE3_AGRTU|nr:hypothetical protein RU07_16245 [Agrobacterium tumefaciens]